MPEAEAVAELMEIQKVAKALMDVSYYFIKNFITRRYLKIPSFFVVKVNC